MQRSRITGVMLVGLGVLIGSLTFGAVWAATQIGTTDVRITAERLEDGRVELGLQQLGGGGVWGETQRPENRFLTPDAEVGALHQSEPITIEVEVEVASREERAATVYYDYLVDAGAGIGERYNARFTDPDHPELVPGRFLCVIDPNDDGIEALCDGLESSYRGPVVRVEHDDWDDLRSELRARMAVQAPVAMLTTSVPTTILALEVRERARNRPWVTYWIELLDQHLAPSVAPFCQVTHSGTLFENEEDFFWGLSSEISAAAAAQLGVSLDFSSHSEVAGQAAAIRECVASGASVITTTLVEPEVLLPAIEEALAADIPVVSFNSGVNAADEIGTVLHIALDDHEAGRIAGEEFNRRKIRGTALCVIHEPNNVGLHERCEGFEETYRGDVERWSAEDPAAARGELAARLDEGDIRATLTLSVHSAWDARIVNNRRAEPVPLAAFGFSVGLARGVLDGSVMFTILDHPELQAYMSTVAAVMAERWRLDPVTYFNGMSLLIRPQIADADYMQRVVDAMYAEPTGE